jgi:hypothetical protein
MAAIQRFGYEYGILPALVTPEQDALTYTQPVTTALTFDARSFPYAVCGLSAGKAPGDSVGHVSFNAFPNQAVNARFDRLWVEGNRNHWGYSRNIFARTPTFARQAGRYGGDCLVMIQPRSFSQRLTRGNDFYPAFFWGMTAPTPATGVTTLVSGNYVAGACFVKMVNVFNRPLTQAAVDAVGASTPFGALKVPANAGLIGTLGTCMNEDIAVQSSLVSFGAGIAATEIAVVNNKLRFIVGGTVVQESTIEMVNDVWYFFTFEILRDASAGQIKAYWDGAEFTFNGNTGATAPDHPLVMRPVNVKTGCISLMDDVSVNDGAGTLDNTGYPSAIAAVKHQTILSGDEALGWIPGGTASSLIDGVTAVNDGKDIRSSTPGSRVNFGFDGTYPFTKTGFEGVNIIYRGLKKTGSGVSRVKVGHRFAGVNTQVGANFNLGFGGADGQGANSAVRLLYNPTNGQKFTLAEGESVQSYVETV